MKRPIVELAQKADDKWNVLPEWQVRIYTNGGDAPGWSYTINFTSEDLAKKCFAETLESFQATPSHDVEAFR